MNSFMCRLEQGTQDRNVSEQLRHEMAVSYAGWEGVFVREIECHKNLNNFYKKSDKICK